MKREGLTLIELLIVIGIIAVLAGIVYSVYGNIRWRTGVTRCMAHLYQCGIALQMYAEDWHGFVPPYISVKIPMPGRKFFSPHADDPSLLSAAFLPYSKSREIWHCSDERKTNSFDPSIFPENHFTSYYIRPRYGTLAIPIHNPPIWVPLEVIYNPRGSERMRCVYCQWLAKTYFRWIYAMDFFHDYHPNWLAGHFGTWVDPHFRLELYLTGRVRALDKWRFSLSHRCPMDKLPPNLPDWLVVSE